MPGALLLAIFLGGCVCVLIKLGLSELFLPQKKKKRFSVTCCMMNNEKVQLYNFDLGYCE